MIKANKESGMSIIGLLFFAVIIILILSYLNISIKAIVESPVGQENVQYVGGGAISLWNNYLKEPISRFWNNFLLPLFRPLFSYIKNITNGQFFDLNNFSMPKLNLGQ